MYVCPLQPSMTANEGIATSVDNGLAAGTIFAKSHIPNLTKYNLCKSFTKTFWWVFSTLTIKTMDVVINSLQGNWQVVNFPMLLFFSCVLLSVTAQIEWYSGKRNTMK